MCDIAQRGGGMMAEVRVKVIEPFYDRENDLVLRAKDEVLTVSEERAQKLISLGHAVEAPEKRKKKNEEEG